MSTSKQRIVWTYSSPTECDNLTIDWTGGHPPFSLQITTEFRDLITIDLPDSSFDGTHGSHSFPLALPAGNRTVFTMSDAAGFGSGGNSAMLTVGSSIAKSTCNTTSTTPGFIFQAPEAFTQCNEFLFSNYLETGATAPVNITGLIPLGDTIFLLAQQSTFSWTVNTRVGTTVIFFMRDAQGKSGGASNFLTTLQSADSSCINPQSPSSTIGDGTTPPTAIPTNSGNTNTAAIAAGSVGAIAALVVTAALIWYFMLRRRKSHDVYEANPYEHGTPGINQRTSRRVAPVDLLAVHRQGYSLTAAASPTESDAPAFGFTSSPSGGTRRAHEGNLSSDDPSLVPDPYLDREPRTPMSDSSGSRPVSKAAMARSERGRSWGPARFVLHTDAGAVDESNEDDVVELPPTYLDVSSAPSTPRRASATTATTSQTERMGNTTPGYAASTHSDSSMPYAAASSYPPSSPSYPSMEHTRMSSPNYPPSSLQQGASPYLDKSSPRLPPDQSSRTQ